MSLAEFLRGIPVRVLPIDDNMFREVTLRVSEPELQALVDLALEGALARRNQQHEITPAMVTALACLQAAVEKAPPPEEIPVNAPPASPPASAAASGSTPPSP